jgi:hypothetical protein
MKRGRKPIYKTDEERKQGLLEYRKNFYINNKNEIKEKAKNYYKNIQSIKIVKKYYNLTDEEVEKYGYDYNILRLYGKLKQNKINCNDVFLQLNKPETTNELDFILTN